MLTTNSKRRSERTRAKRDDQFATIVHPTPNLSPIMRAYARDGRLAFLCQEEGLVPGERPYWPSSYNNC